MESTVILEIKAHNEGANRDFRTLWEGRERLHPSIKELITCRREDFHDPPEQSKSKARNYQIVSTKQSKDIGYKLTFGNARADFGWTAGKISPEKVQNTTALDVLLAWPERDMSTSRGESYFVIQLDRRSGKPHVRCKSQKSQVSILESGKWTSLLYDQLRIISTTSTFLRADDQEFEVVAPVYSYNKEEYSNYLAGLGEFMKERGVTIYDPRISSTFMDGKPFPRAGDIILTSCARDPAFGNVELGIDINTAEARLVKQQKVLNSKMRKMVLYQALTSLAFTVSSNQFTHSWTTLHE